MLDIKFIRENSELIAEAARKKCIKIDLERLLAVDEKRRALIQEVDEMRRVHKEASDRIGAMPQEKRGEFIAELKSAKDRLSHKEFELKSIEAEFDELMFSVPNIPDPSVPNGKSDEENQEIRDWKPYEDESALPTLSSISGEDYLTIMKRHEMVDLERGAKVAGFRGYFLKNDGAILSMAMWRFALDHLIKKGFVPFLAPSIVHEENLIGTGWIGCGVSNQAKDDVYKTQDELYLAGTAEVPMMGFHAREILTEQELPKKYAAFSLCFRREAGSYGKDTRGIYRVHEFFKVEQIVLCKAEHQESVRWHEELTKNSEEIMRALEIPYRVVLNCGGDLGLGQVKKYDIEGWLPSENRYRETHSASYFHDFQTRRLNIKYRSLDGELRFVHSLNNTAIATPRILEQFLENHQRPDGSISIPKALQQYFGKEKIKKERS